MTFIVTTALERPLIVRRVGTRWAVIPRAIPGLTRWHDTFDEALTDATTSADEIRRIVSGESA